MNNIFKLINLIVLIAIYASITAGKSIHETEDLKVIEIHCFTDTDYFTGNCKTIKVSYNGLLRFKGE